MVSRVLLVTVCAVLLPAVQASAQIYAWRDVNGTLVLSDKTIDAPTDVYTVEGAPTIRTTRKAERDVTERYEDLVLAHSSANGLRPELVRAVIQVESGFNPRARSPKGAMGLMQLMPATARTLGVQNAWDPDDNIRGGTKYLRMLLDRYQGDERLALAAYNAGSGAVDRYGGTVPPYRETRDYVRKVGSAADGTRTGTGAGTGKGVTPGKLVIYKTIEVVDGRAIPRYSSEQPPAGTYEIVKRDPSF
jgi:soluble lytic murein transglycosylase-like protein